MTAMAVSDTLGLMKKIPALMLFVLVSILPGVVLSHPGKTDRYDGHRCLKDCEEWKLYYKEYHLHDKDRKPIRIAKKPKKQDGLASSPTATEIAVQPEVPITVQTVTAYRYSAVEETSPFNPFLWILLILLLLLLILRLNRRESERK